MQVEFKLVKIFQDRCLNRYQWYLAENLSSNKYTNSIWWSTKSETFLDYAKLAAMEISMDLLLDYPDEAWLYDRMLYSCLDWTGWNYDRFVADHRPFDKLGAKKRKPAVSKKGKSQKGAKDES